MTVAEINGWRFALVGTPNSGKTALFNALTGSRQKVANYAGVTVERKTGVLRTASGHRIDLVDLPGTYSLRGAQVGDGRRGPLADGDGGGGSRDDAVDPAQ